MAKMAKMDTCPTCGATIAKNLAERVRNGVPGYSCPGTTTQPSRKEFEEQWGRDFTEAEIKHQFEELNKRERAFLDGLEPCVCNSDNNIL